MSPSLWALRFVFVAVCAGITAALGIWVSTLGGLVLTIVGAGLFAVSGTVFSMAVYDQIVILVRLYKERTATRSLAPRI